MIRRSILIWTLIVLPSAAHAASDCWTIQDPDQRAYCRAVATNSAGQCVAISDFGLRQTCYARLGKTPSNCNTLSSSWEREECKRLAESGKK